jgi:hypothetical protein
LESRDGGLVALEGQLDHFAAKFQAEPPRDPFLDPTWRVNDEAVETLPSETFLQTGCKNFLPSRVTPTAEERLTGKSSRVNSDQSICRR